MDFNGISGVYDSGRSLAPEGLAEWRAALAGLAPGPDEPPLLDLGAGTGIWSSAFADWFGTRVVAVEPAAGMRREASRNRPHPRVWQLGGEAERVPLRDGACAAAWLSHVVHHVGDPARCARELRRVVRPGGTVMLRQAFADRIDPDNLTIFRWFPSAMAVARGFLSVADVESAFAGAGWTVRSLTKIPQVTAPSLRAALARVRHRADTGLQAIPDEDFAAGLAALARAAGAEADAEAAGGGDPAPVVDRIDLLVLG
jgi:ubiquinone/menaquinone biosynthesis C-methylase UbiE